MRLRLKMEILKRFGPGRQYELARIVGLSESNLSRVVLARRDPTAREKRAIERVLGVPGDELFEVQRQSGDAHAAARVFGMKPEAALVTSGPEEEEDAP